MALLSSIHLRIQRAAISLQTRPHEVPIIPALESPSMHNAAPSFTVLTEYTNPFKTSNWNSSRLESVGERTSQKHNKVFFYLSFGGPQSPAQVQVQIKMKSVTDNHILKTFVFEQCTTSIPKSEHILPAQSSGAMYIPLSFASYHLPCPIVHHYKVSLTFSIRHGIQPVLTIASFVIVHSDIPTS